MVLNTVEQKLLNALNKITVKRDFYKFKSQFLENNPDKVAESNPFKYTIKYSKTLLTNVEIATLLEISTKLIDFHEKFCLQDYINYFIELFDIQEECRDKIEYNFNQHVYQYLKDNNNKILLIKYIINLTDVLSVIDKNLEDKNLEEIIAKYINSKTELDLEYCNNIASDVIDHF